MRRAALGVVAAVVGALLAACGSEPPRGLLVPVVRWLDAPPPTPLTDVEWGRRVKIADEARLAIVPATASSDIVGAPFVVPAGAVASVGLGVDEGAWSANSGPVEFRIGVVDGTEETVLARTTLDPARRPDDRRWTDLRVDLSALAGRRVQLALRTAPADPERATPSLPLWADPVVLAPSPAWMPNVVLMSLDTLRARSVSAYGSTRPTTPNLDHMVGDAGTIFDNAYTTAPHTLPAHLSAFTGLYRRMLGGVTAVNPLSRDIPTLPERLRAAGYETGAFTEDVFVIPKAGFERGFSTYVEDTSPGFREPLGQSAKTFRAAADWLSARRDHPTFLFVHTYEVHSPYTPAPPYDRAFEDPQTLPNENAVALLRYEQEARYLDDELRAFLDALDGLGLGTRTLLVVMADHGEEFGEHGLRRHGFQLYEETTHVPLMLRWPAVVPAGLRVKTPVSLVDLLPTILDLVGAPPVPGVHGESLVPLLAGGSLSAERQVVFGEALSVSDTGGVDLVSTRSADLHCIFNRRTGRSACFDPDSDRDEKVPRSDPLDQIELSRDAVAVYLNLVSPTAAAPTPADAPPSTTDRTERERLEKLRALGYVQ